MEGYLEECKREASLATTHGSASLASRVSVSVPVKIDTTLAQLENGDVEFSLEGRRWKPAGRRGREHDWDTDHVIVLDSVARGPTVNTMPVAVGLEVNFQPRGYHTDDRQQEIEMVNAMLSGRPIHMAAAFQPGVADPDASIPLVKSESNRLNGHWVAGAFGCFTSADQLLRGTMRMERGACQALGLPPPPNMDQDPSQTYVMVREPHALTWALHQDKRALEQQGIGALRFGNNDDGYWLVDAATAVRTTQLLWSKAQLIDHRRVGDLRLRLHPVHASSWTSGCLTEEEKHRPVSLHFTWIVTYVIFTRHANAEAVPTIPEGMVSATKAMELKSAQSMQ